MTREEVFEMVSQYFTEQFEVPLEKIEPKAHLFKQLGLDSIDALDMIAYLEAELDIEVVEKELKSLRIVQDVVDYILTKVGEG